MIQSSASTSSATDPVVDIVWLHNDLRIKDNPLLHFSSRPEHLVCVYVLDERWLASPIPREDTSRIGPARLQFLWQSLMALRGELLKRGSDLLVKVGSPVEEITRLALALDARTVHVAAQDGVEETAHIQQVASQLKGVAELSIIESNALVNAEDLPFSLDELPASFSGFRRKVEKACVYPEPLPAPVTLPSWPDQAGRGLPSLNQVSQVMADWTPDARGFTYEGGEQAGMDHLERYIWDHQGPSYYKETRNGLLGSHFSTRLSAWLAHGCLSPRQVHHAVKAWEARHGSSESSYWITFELLWRDFFMRAAQRDGKHIFGRRQLPAANKDFDAWRYGTTGVPFVDAPMDELRKTGWISNRARQNVASFLVKDLGVDWRLGAAWFEHCLVDYAVGSNWGNWGYVAGIGRDPRADRYFNVLKQASQYDGKGEYVAHWVPALADLPKGAERHQPWIADPSRFEPPRVQPSAWSRYLIR